MRVMRRVDAFAVLIVVVAACNQVGTTQAPAATEAPASLAPSAIPTTAATPAAQPTTLNPAPAEMIGKWRAELAPEDVATIDITASLIRITRFATATVRLEVFGDELVLSHSQLCTGEGRYAWSIEDDKLRFDSIELDPCDGRAKTFDGITYTRVTN